VPGKRRLLDSVRPLRRTPAIDLNAAVANNLGPIVLALVAVVIALAVVVVALARRIRGLDARLRLLTRGDEGDLEDVLDAHLDRVHVLGREVERLVARTGRLESAASRAFQRVGLVRFNPFEDTGGNQSFALALLDAEGNGWVLSSLHARSGTRVYAKAVREGRSDGALSDEEAAAIKQATA
jgi:HAMP domain-containing protein